MRKYNIAVVFILILLTISISTYFFYLDIIYKNKFVKHNVQELSNLKNIATMPILKYANKQELEKKTLEYNQIIQELNLNAIAQAQKNDLVIKGTIHNSLSYVLLKRLLNIIKNDEVNLISTCIGKECTKDDYGFLIKFRPYLLKIK